MCIRDRVVAVALPLVAAAAAGSVGAAAAAAADTGMTMGGVGVVGAGVSAGEATLPSSTEFRLAMPGELTAEPRELGSPILTDIWQRAAML